MGMSNASFPEDFFDAMDRHWHDAELLRSNKRLANADHLYGLSAECGLKALMKKIKERLEKETQSAQGLSTSPDGQGRISQASPELESKDRKHINDLFDRYETYLDNYVDGTKFCLPGEPFGLPWQSEDSPFANWNVSDRYASRTHFTNERLEEHRSGAEDVKKLVAKLEKKGLLP